MSKLDVYTVLRQLSEMSAKVVGPFLVFDFVEEPALFDALEVGEHGMEKVPHGKATKSHSHDFMSVYKAVQLDIISEGVKFELPVMSLVIVFPGTVHSWIPKVESGHVGSCDTSHDKQELVVAEQF